MASSPAPLPRVLIIGCGSIGERHLRCFQSTGRCSPHVCDTNPDLLARVAEHYAVPSYPGADAALAAAQFDALVICTPAQTHLDLARKGAGHGAALLIEKPLSVSWDDLEETRAVLAKSGRYVAIAYVYHCFPWFAAAHEAIRAGAVGTPLHASLVSGQHFPTFRPAYREIYYTRHETGGGAIQDALTHLVNAMEWLIGPVTRVYCDASHQCLEGVTVEDTVNLAARHDRVLASYALNQFQPANEMVLQIHGDLGSLRIEHHAQRWGLIQSGESEWTWRTSPPLSRDAPFIAQAHAFLDGMEGKPAGLCTFDEGAQTLRVNLAALQSSQTGQAIRIS